MQTTKYHKVLVQFYDGGLFHTRCTLHRQMLQGVAPLGSKPEAHDSCFPGIPQHLKDLACHDLSLNILKLGVLVCVSLHLSGTQLL